MSAGLICSFFRVCYREAVIDFAGSENDSGGHLVRSFRSGRDLKLEGFCFTLDDGESLRLGEKNDPLIKVLRAGVGGRATCMGLCQHGRRASRPISVYDATFVALESFVWLKTYRIAARLFSPR